MEKCTSEIERSIDNSDLYKKEYKVSMKKSDKDLNEAVERSKIIFDYLSELKRDKKFTDSNEEFYRENCIKYKARSDVYANRQFDNKIRGNN